jgi:hypothetical protein
MVTQAQVQNADPVYQKILTINSTLQGINATAASLPGFTGPITLYIGGGPGGNSVQIDLTPIGVANVLNDLFALSNSTLSTLNAQLAAI